MSGGDVKVSATVARPLAEALVGLLAPVCERIMIAGSLRRRKLLVGDIELVCIPKYDNGLVDLLDRKVQQLLAEGLLEYRRNTVGSKVYGPKNKLLRHVSGLGVDIFSTDTRCWAVALVVRTGGAATNMVIARRALARGMQFHAYGAGFTMRDGSELACQTEEAVFTAVGLPYLDPSERL